MHSRLSAQLVICAALVLALAATVLAQGGCAERPCAASTHGRYAFKAGRDAALSYQRYLIDAGAKREREEEPG